MENNINLNKFPLEVFPAIFKELIENLNVALNFPIDYSGTAVLVAISTAVGTTRKVKVKNNWYEYASVYCCLIGNAGANKTHPVNTLFDILKSFDNKTHDEYVEKLKKFNIYEKLNKSEKKTAIKVEEPKLKKHILVNFTPEALNKRLNENLKGCTIVSDEMATFFEGMNNYSKGDQISIYLSMWSNQSTTIDRVGEKIPFFIKTPFLSIIGGLQPRMLNSAFPQMKLNNGFFQRFLFAFIESTFKQPINDNEIDILLLNNYNEFIAKIIEENISFENNETVNSKILNWTNDAKIFFYEWQTENCNLVNENSNSIKGEILSKYDNHFVRLSLLLQIMENPQSEFIEIKAVIGAKKLCAYYLQCSFKVLAIITNPINYLETLPDNKKKMYKELKIIFTTAEAIVIGNKYEILERQVKTFIKDEILFNNIKHGYYEKIIK